MWLISTASQRAPAVCCLIWSVGCSTMWQSQPSAAHVKYRAVSRRLLILVSLSFVTIEIQEFDFTGHELSLNSETLLYSSSSLISLSVPCVPTNVQGVVECSTHTLQASWDAGCPTCAASYISTLTGEGGFSTSCAAANGSCTFPGLQCAQTYMLSVVAFNDRCNSSTSAVVSATTGKCPNNTTLRMRTLISCTF